VIYPADTDQSPGRALYYQGIRTTFAESSSVHIDAYYEYVDDARSPDTGQLLLQVEYLQRKYSGRKVDLVISCGTLGFVLKFRDRIFPRVPVVSTSTDEGQGQAQKLPADVLNVPRKLDMRPTLDLALRLHPNTRSIFVITGTAPFDAQRKAEAQKTFVSYEKTLEFRYVNELPMEKLLHEVARLPDRSIILYLCFSQDGTGQPFVPGAVLERLAAVANAPIYGVADSYLGRGVVGGHMYSFEGEGQLAARLGLRILEGEKPETISVPESGENAAIFDWRQLRRWGINEGSLPNGSEVRFKEPDLLDLYKWRVIGVITLCVIEAVLISGLLVQRRNRRRAEDGLRESQRELRLLTGRVLLAQETERGRIARELHDDLNQSLALLAVQLDLLSQKPAESPARLNGQIQEMSARVKQLSSSVHDLSHQLHPSKLGQLGLVAAIRSLCRELTQVHGLPIEFTPHGVPAVIPEDTALCLYRIAQEALRNSIKHSGARHAGVELSGNTDAIDLRIVDDGAGFEAGTVESTGGLGLLSMRERLHLIGGAITIDSRPSNGTRIDVRVPLAAIGQADAACEELPSPQDGELVDVPAFER
jgi:signal transduction histidine kinase